MEEDVVTWSDLAAQVGLERAADDLVAAAARAPDRPRLALEAGIADKLRGRIDEGLASLLTAAARLPRHDLEGRQRALFVIALTWCDLDRRDLALRTVDELVILDPESSWAEAARGYADAWRE